MKALLCAALAACFLGACGSNGSTSSTSPTAATPPSPAQRGRFVKKANALCREFSAGIDAGLATTPTDGSHIYESFFFQLRFLAPRDPRLVAFVEDGLRIADSYGELEDVVRERRGSVAFAKAEKAIDRVKARFRRSARASGIDACAGGHAFAAGSALPKLSQFR